MKTWPCDVSRFPPVSLRIGSRSGLHVERRKAEGRRIRGLGNTSAVLVIALRGETTGHSGRHSDFPCLVYLLHQVNISPFVAFVPFCSKRVGGKANRPRMVPA